MKDSDRGNKKSPRNIKMNSILVIKLVVFGTILLFVIPLLIHVAFKLEAPICFFVPKWKAGDVLTFYGALVAAAATIYGVHLSIQSAQKNYREDIRNRSLPLLAIFPLHAVFRTHLGFAPEDKDGLSEDDDKEEDKTYYEEIRLNKLFFVISEGGITNKIVLNKVEQGLVRSRGYVWEDHNGEDCLVNKHIISFPFDVENVGNGPAIHLRIGFNKADQESNYSYPLAMESKDTIYIHIFAEKATDNVLGKYNLDFIYEDMIGNTYKQQYPIRFEKDSETGRIYHYFAWEGKQIIVDKNR